MATKERTANRLSERAASEEFRIDRATLRKKMKAAGEVAASDGKFSIWQIHSAISGGKDNAQERKLNAEADIAELKFRKLSSALVPLDQVETDFNAFVMALRSAVMSLDVSKKDRIRLMDTLREKAREDFLKEKEADDEEDEQN